MDKDLRKVVKASIAQGFTWDETKSGHPRAWKDGVFVATFSGTPGDVRGFRNSLAAMRRAGLVWPPKR